MAKKTNSPRMGQQTKTSAKGGHGGGVKYGMVTPKPAGINRGKSVSKLPQPKSGFVKSISEGAIARPSVVFGRGFGMNPFLMEAKKWGQTALKKADKPPSKGGTKGSLRKALGKKKGQKISRTELKKTIDSSKTTPKVKQKALAIYNLGGGKKGKKSK